MVNVPPTSTLGPEFAMLYTLPSRIRGCLASGVGDTTTSWSAGAGGPPPRPAESEDQRDDRTEQPHARRASISPWSAPTLQRRSGVQLGQRARPRQHVLHRGEIAGCQVAQVADPSGRPQRVAVEALLEIGRPLQAEVREQGGEAVGVSDDARSARSATAPRGTRLAPGPMRPSGSATPAGQEEGARCFSTWLRARTTTARNATRRGPGDRAPGHLEPRVGDCPWTRTTSTTTISGKQPGGTRPAATR